MQQHLINDLYGEGYDFGHSPVDPDKMVMVSAIPRSGSTLLCIKLWQTGVCGAPMEYLNFANRKNDMLVRLGNGDPVAYWNELRRRRTSRNGVFAFKAFVGDYTQTMQDYADLLPHIRSDKTIYLTRRDKLQQAVSYARAFQSGKWFAIASETAAPVYDRQSIDHALHWIRMAEDAWERIYALKSCTPIRVYYEDLQDNPEETVRGLLDRLDIAAPDPIFPLPIPEVRKQRDGLSDEWLRLYCEETKQAVA